MRCRERAGLSQRRLGALAGTSGPAIAAYEAGRHEPTWPTLARICAAAGTPLRIDEAELDPLTPSDRRSLAIHQAIAQVALRSARRAA